MNSHYSQFQNHSFFRPPDWRWRRARWLIDRRRNFSRPRDDEDTGRAVHYLRSLARGRNGVPGARLLDEFSDVHAARQLHEGVGVTRQVIQARLLARQTTAEIALRTGVSCRAINTYESLFFCCRDRINARDWIATFAIGYKPFARPSAPDANVVLKAFAYFGGPRVLAAVLPYLVGGKDPLDPPLDLSTPAGRCEQRVRLAVTAQMLPENFATTQKLHKIMLILLESDRKPPVRHAPTPILAQNINLRLEKWFAEASSLRVEQAKLPVVAGVEAVLRQTA